MAQVPKMAKLYASRRGRLFAKLHKTYKDLPRFHAKGKSVSTKRL
jgi:hypothetical protein